MGTPFASQKFDVTPDIMTMAKAITNGSMPMGAVCVKDHIYETVTDNSNPDTIEFFHGYTYSGHPVHVQQVWHHLKYMRRKIYLTELMKCLVIFLMLFFHSAIIH